MKGLGAFDRHGLYFWIYMLFGTRLLLKQLLRRVDVTKKLLHREHLLNFLWASARPKILACHYNLT
jgi:hypothetical protein